MWQEEPCGIFEMMYFPSEVPLPFFIINSCATFHGTVLLLPMSAWPSGGESHWQKMGRTCQEVGTGLCRSVGQDIGRFRMWVQGRETAVLLLTAVIVRRGAGMSRGNAPAWPSLYRRQQRSRGEAFHIPLKGLRDSASWFCHCACLRRHQRICY